MVRNIKFIISVFIGLVVFFILLNALEKTNNYSPNKISNKRVGSIWETCFSPKMGTRLWILAHAQYCSLVG